MNYNINSGGLRFFFFYFLLFIAESRCFAFFFIARIAFIYIFRDCVGFFFPSFWHGNAMTLFGRWFFLAGSCVNSNFGVNPNINVYDRTTPCTNIKIMASYFLGSVLEGFSPSVCDLMHRIAGKNRHY
jgi:hypothetical protein